MILTYRSAIHKNNSRKSTIKVTAQKPTVVITDRKISKFRLRKSEPLSPMRLSLFFCLSITCPIHFRQHGFLAQLHPPSILKTKTRTFSLKRKKHSSYFIGASGIFERLQLIMVDALFQVVPRRTSYTNLKIILHWAR